VRWVDPIHDRRCRVPFEVHRPARHAGAGPRARASAAIAVLLCGFALCGFALCGFALAAPAILGATTTVAQRSPEPQGEPERGRGAPAGDDLRETITLLMMVRMKSELGLSKQQYEEILPKIEEHEQVRQTGFRQRRLLVDRVRDLLAKNDVKDSDLLAAIDKLIAQDESDRRKDVAFVDEVRKLLTPRQQAQFVLFRQRFRQWLENRMRDARELRGGGRHGTQGQDPRSGAEDGGDCGAGTEDEAGGAGALPATGSRMTEPRSPPSKARLNDVIANTIAIPVVIFPSTVGVPMEPKTAWLPAPPNAEPMSAPLPACRSTMPMMPKHMST